tara:strand:+ start:1055 stop:1177 length:123 start_codon:yes stop_codon:yes gene_type:complete
MYGFVKIRVKARPRIRENAGPINPVRQSTNNPINENCLID